MYFVDRGKIHETLAYVDQLLNTLDDVTLETHVERLSLERITQIVIESILDVGNMMIDGFIMRDPGSYEDIIDILIDETVLPSEDEMVYKEVLRLRKQIVQEYLHIDHKALKETMFKHKEVIKHFKTHVENYLDNELDVAHAFSND